MYNLAFWLIWFFICQSRCSGREFYIDRDQNSFILDGEKFRFISGSYHYFRVPPAYWDDRFRKIRAGGYNAVQIYVEWSSHEPEPGVFDFSGRNDLENFIELAHKNDLFVILRPGPFIDAERDMGGLPFWLLQKNPDVKLRTNDPKFMVYAERFLKILYSKMSKFLIENGGPIIMVQIENEYGSYSQQTKFFDINYVIRLRDLAREHLNSTKVVLFTVDGCGTEYLRNGKVPEVYSAVDFHASSNASECFQYLRSFEAKGPLINPEFYTGWIDHWSEPHQQIDSKLFAKSLDTVLSLGANINMYMVTGGTSFGFEAGANDPPFRPSPTSYDYDAPISEAGDLRDKYFAIKEVIRKYLPIPEIEVNATTEKGHYGPVKLQPVSSLIHEPFMFAELRASSTYPLTFEALGQNHGLVLYETVVTETYSDPAKLEVLGMHDRGYIFVDGHLKGILSRMYDVFSMPIHIRKNQLLQIVVENQGRICYGPNTNDFKGLTTNVTISGNILTNWKITGIPFTNKDRLMKTLAERENRILQNSSLHKQLMSYLDHSHGSMSFWTGSFETPCNEDAKDTFANVDNWHKGILFINGFNLGRYWPTEGPQKTLYVPATILHGKCKTNKIILFEQDKPPCIRDCHSKLNTIEFVTSPKIDGPTPISLNNN